VRGGLSAENFRDKAYAKARRNQAQDGKSLDDFLDDARRETLLDANRMKMYRECRIRKSVEHELFVFQRSNSDAFATGQAVLRWHDDANLFGPGPLRDEVSLLRREA